MTGTELSDRVNEILRDLAGEQYKRGTLPNGNTFFALHIMGVPVGLTVESLGDSEALLAGHHVIGTKVEDRQAAAEFVTRRNQTLRVGRVMLIEDSVVSFHHLFAAGVNKETVRTLLGLLAAESQSHPDLAAAAGALTLAEAQSPEALDESS